MAGDKVVQGKESECLHYVQNKKSIRQARSVRLSAKNCKIVLLYITAYVYLLDKRHVEVISCKQISGAMATLDGAFLIEARNAIPT